ncbi:hypothetical protein FRB96_002195 [Tulasnella sp. 330]|nr:hypothetical protein FRB96_002195 [Tulasnella sp. 330]KAG8880934.1 hypothetical protein FRB97_000327 [Tulasnella sp. 331]KAG8889583.1 hypothetical protein FRB98_003645 [Tulasnella sp. 332]
MTTLPPLASALQVKDDLNTALSILFEPSSILTSTLVPQLYTKLALITPPPTTYSVIVDLVTKQLQEWQPLPKAAFIESHPRIGEVKGLSALSDKEQATTATPPATLARLAHLNEMYERRYTGLRFVVFVNGRSRAEIVPVMEAKLGIGPAAEGREDEPSTDTVLPLDAGDEEWGHELNRAVHDVCRIAKARLQALGVQ